MSLTFLLNTVVKLQETQAVHPHLIWRPNSIYNWAIVSLFASFILITITKLNTPYFFKTLISAIYKNRNVKRIYLDEFPLSRVSHFLLLINYFLNLSFLTFFLLNENVHESFWFSFLTAIVVPIYFYFSPLLFLSVTEFISGEKNFSHEIKMTNTIVNQFFGLVCMGTLLFWVFNNHLHQVLQTIVFSVIIFMFLFRLFRGFVFAFSKSLPWYYIILYFCTFELLPFYLIYHYISMKYV
jgi:hypothetical protein